MLQLSNERVIMHQVYPESLFIRITGGMMAIVAAAVSLVGAILALTPAPPVELNNMYSGFLVGGLLAIFFIYLSIRLFRYGLVVTLQDVQLPGFLWTTRIPIRQINSIEKEDLMNDGSWDSIFVARDLHRNRLFPLTLPRAAEIVDVLLAVKGQDCA